MVVMYTGNNKNKDNIIGETRRSHETSRKKFI